MQRDPENVVGAVAPHADARRGRPRARCVRDALLAGLAMHPAVSPLLRLVARAMIVATARRQRELRCRLAGLFDIPGSTPPVRSGSTRPRVSSPACVFVLATLVW